MLPLLIGAGISQLCGILGNQAQSGTTGGTTSGTAGGSSASTDFQRLLTDLQAGTSPASGTAATDPTSAVANDLKSLLGDVSGASGHHHHHHVQQAQGSTATPAGNPLQSVASSLLAYAQNHLLGAPAATTSLTA